MYRILVSCRSKRLLLHHVIFFFSAIAVFRTTKSHRRIGAVGSKGDARIRPGKRMPGHMGYEWRSIPGLEVLRINPEKQVFKFTKEDEFFAE